MKRFCFFLLIALFTFIAVSCASTEAVAEEPAKVEMSETAKAEKGTSTVAIEDAAVMPVVLMEDTGALSLFKAYQDKGIEIGTCTLPPDMELDWVKDTIISQFSSFCPFEGFKALQLLDQEASIKNGRLTVTFDEATKSAMQWARDNGKKVHGHTLIWFKSNPEWMFRENFQDDAPYVSRDVMLQRLEDYMKGVFEGIEENGWTDLIYAFDIINEYYNTDGSAPNDGPWIQIIGDDVIWHAFNYANKYAPESIKLIYNESYCEISETKRDAAVALLKTLVDENGNYLADGIGLQCRLALRNKIDSVCENIDYIARNIDGLELQLTEVDCTISTKAQVLEANLKKQGTYLYKVMEKVLQLIDEGYKVTAVQVSGCRDDLDPLVAVSGAPSIYDVKGNEKYSYFGLLQMKELSGFEE